MILHISGRGLKYAYILSLGIGILGEKRVNGGAVRVERGLELDAEVGQHFHHSLSGIKSSIEALGQTSERSVRLVEGTSQIRLFPFESGLRGLDLGRKGDGVGHFGDAAAT